MVSWFTSLLKLWLFSGLGMFEDIEDAIIKAQLCSNLDLSVDDADECESSDREDDYQKNWTHTDLE